MNQYVFVLNESGKRVTTLVDNIISKDELLKIAKQKFPNAANYIYSPDGDDMLDKFMSNKLYVNGKFVEAPTEQHKPSKEELQTSIMKQVNTINLQLSELQGISECAITVDGKNEYDVFVDGQLVTMTETEFLNYFDELTNKRSDLLQQYKELK